MRKIPRATWISIKNCAKKVAQNVIEGSRCLEVAPGPGYLSIELMKTGKLQYNWIRHQQNICRNSKPKAKEEGVKVNFMEGDASNMTFDNETFDFIVCTAAFKNFTKPIMAINEMYRVLKPNGKALIIDLRRDASKDAINERC